LIFLNNYESVLPLNGKVPQRMANNSTPIAQISAGGPAYDYFDTISGAIYDGVPQKIFIMH